MLFKPSKMGRRSINTTKSGKYMNPTDQFRKEARKRELKKNKRQRMMVRQAVLKGKDPVKLLEEMEAIDRMEYNPLEAPSLNEKVLREKRKKLRETFDRVLRLYEKEKPEYALELKKAESEYDGTRRKLVHFFEQVRNAERVQLDQIPLPDALVDDTLPCMIPLPNEIPLPTLDGYLENIPPGILKKRSVYDSQIYGPVYEWDMMCPYRPPGPPPGPPPLLSDSENEYDPAKDLDDEGFGVDRDGVQHSEEMGESSDRTNDIPDDDDDNEAEGAEQEKDTRLKLGRSKNLKDGGGVSALQARMLQIAGQDIPVQESDNSSSGSSDEEEVDKEEEERRATALKKRLDLIAHLDENDDDDDNVGDEKDADDEKGAKSVIIDRPVPPGPPPGAPPNFIQGLPPGPPPGVPRMLMRPLLMTGVPPPRLIPPGPPPGRPQGLPPGPPPGLPPNMRVAPLRLPLVPTGVPPPRLLHPPGAPPILHPNILPSMIPMPSSKPTVLSAPPSIMKPPVRVHGDMERMSSATIEAKPKIKAGIGDVTRFTPTAVKIKRNLLQRGRLRVAGKVNEASALNVSTKPTPMPATQIKMKDDAYDQFMKEMAGLI